MAEENENSSFLQLLSVVHKRKTILTLKIHKLKILPPVTRIFQTASGDFVFVTVSNLQRKPKLPKKLYAKCWNLLEKDAHLKLHSKLIRLLNWNRKIHGTPTGKLGITQECHNTALDENGTWVQNNNDQQLIAQLTADKYNTHCTTAFVHWCTE